MEKIKRKYIELILGIILLLPPIFSVVALFLQFFGSNLMGDCFYLYNSSVNLWTGGGEGGFTSALPFYFGLMALAGAYLISNSTKK